MKKKFIALTLLAVATGALAVSCDNTNDSSSDPSADTSSSSSSETWATRVKITQPGTLVVGDTLKISEIVTVTPEGGKYNVVVTKGADTVVTLGDDNNTITVVGAGEAAVQLKGSTGNVLGQISITAMTAAGKALQEFSDSLSNNYLADCTWNEIKGVWAEYEEGTAYAESEGCGLLVTPSYVVDGTYGRYSAIALAKDDGTTYGFTLLDAKGTELDYSAGMEVAFANAASVDLDARVSSAYLENYFVIDGLLNVLDYTEGEDGWFTLNDGTTSTTLIQNLLGMVVSSYTGVGAKVKLTDGVLTGEVKFDYESTVGCSIEFTVKKDYKVAVLETAAAEAEPPAKTDVTALANTYAQFKHNYVMSWEVGNFAKITGGLVKGYINNVVGLTYYTENAVIYGYAFRDETTGEIVKDSGNIGGYYADDTGFYEISLDTESNVIVKSSTADSSLAGYTSVYDVYVTAQDMTSDILNGADLTDLGADTYDQEHYSYNASYDSMGLFGIIEKMTPRFYSIYFSNNAKDYAKFSTGYIINAGSAVATYVGINSWFDKEMTTSGVLGWQTVLSSAGQAVDAIGKKSYEAFASLFSDPSASTDTDSSSSAAE